ncbi:MAG: fasciclin domain-containing protein [Ardenticatenales bacterium]|nr:fasciclin domain-containing protein [Ardenticatenales bacterium]
MLVVGLLVLTAVPVAAQGSDIVDTAAANGNFNTVGTALKASGLSAMLKGEGPFTVFAPTDAAFEKVPASMRQAILADQALLKSVLTYHVVPGNMSLEALKGMNGKTLTTAQGEMLQVTVAGDTVSLNNVPITTPDVVASNGVIHGIGGILMPPTVAQAMAAAAGGAAPATVPTAGADNLTMTLPLTLLLTGFFLLSGAYVLRRKVA